VILITQINISINNIFNIFNLFNTLILNTSVYCC